MSVNNTCERGCETGELKEAFDVTRRDENQNKELRESRLDLLVT